MNGYCLTVNELLKVEEEVFIDKLKKFIPNYSTKEKEQKEIRQIEAWKDCLSYLKRNFRHITDTKILNTPLVFEYKLIDNTRIDMLICCEDRVIIIEFKSGKDDSENTLTEYEQQLDRYYYKLKDYNKFIWNNNIDVLKFLLFTNKNMTKKVQGKEFMKAEHEFEDIIGNITSPIKSDNLRELIENNNEASPDVLELLKIALDKEKLPELFTNTESIKNCTKLIERIYREDRKNTLNIIFVNGAAGTGKTAVGFNILKNSINSDKNINVKYTTGNRNLYEVFSHMINNPKDKKKKMYITSQHIEKVMNICNSKDFINVYMNGERNNKPTIDSDIIIFDEAQRAWSKEKLAIDSNNYEVYDKGISQPYCILHSLATMILNKKKSKTIICLIGNGQEIYIGEEKGDDSWIEAINLLSARLEKYNKNVNINIYCHERSKYKKEIKSNKKVTKEFYKCLLLSENKRGYNINEYLEFVEDILSNKIYKARDILKEINNKYPVRIFNKFEHIKDYLETIDSNYKIGLISTSYEDKTICIDKYKFRNVEKKNLSEWFMSESSDLQEYVTEFDCQGLEIDIPILIWGYKLKIRSNEWQYDDKNPSKKLKRYHENLCNLDKERFKEEDFQKFEEEIVRNIYRVLLTRGRSGIILYVEDKETFDYLNKLNIK